MKVVETCVLILKQKCQCDFSFSFLWFFGNTNLRYITANFRARLDDNNLCFIQDIHQSYDPLQYSLIYADSQNGSHSDLSHTCLQHVKYQLMDRVCGSDADSGVVNPILCGRSLGQQFMVDQFAKVEVSCLTYIENH